MELFISYSRIDEYKILQIIDILRSAGFNPFWDDKMDIGINFKEELSLKIQSCDAFIYLISPDSIASEWCQWELATAIAHSRPVIPVLIRENIIIPDSLKHLNCMDATDGFTGKNVAKLIASLSRPSVHRPITTYLHDSPKGLPSSVKRTLPDNYKTVSQSYFQPYVKGMATFKKENANPEKVYPNEGHIIGIDFGTSFSSISIARNGKTELIPDKQGKLSIPTAIAIDQDGVHLFGDDAIHFLQKHPERGIIEVKRLLSDHDFLDSEDSGVIEIDGIAYTIFDFTLLFICELKSCAEEYLQSGISEVVLTTPVSFKVEQHNFLAEVFDHAGLDVKRVIPEPIAACLANNIKDNELWFVYDLGGGTFDVSIIESGDGILEVLSSNGNNQPGGADFDKILVDSCIDYLEKRSFVDVKENIGAMMLIRSEAEKAKIKLSSTDKATINIPAFTLSNQQADRLKFEITISEYNDLTKVLIDETIDLSIEAIIDSGIKLSDITKVLLVGKAGRAAGIILSLEDLFENKVRLAPDNIVAVGAGIQAGILAGEIKDSLLLDTCPRTIRLQLDNDTTTPLILKNTIIPFKTSVGIKVKSSLKEAFTIGIYEGESVWKSKNNLLFEAEIPPQAVASMEEVDFLADINANHLFVLKLNYKGETLVSIKHNLRGDKKATTLKAKKSPKNFLVFNQPLNTYSSKLNRNKAFLTNWICVVTSKLVIRENKKFTSFKSKWWTDLLEHANSRPIKQIPSKYTEEPIFQSYQLPRELIVDNFEMYFNRDLKILRKRPSIASLINKLEELEELW